MTPEQFEDAFDKWRMLHDNKNAGLDYSTFPALKKYLLTLLAQTRQDTVREVIEKMDKLHDKYQGEFHGGYDDPDVLTQRETALSDLANQLREDYNIKE